MLCKEKKSSPRSYLQHVILVLLSSKTTKIVQAYVCVYVNIHIYNKTFIILHICKVNTHFKTVILWEKGNMWVKHKSECKLLSVIL